VTVQELFDYCGLAREGWGDCEEKEDNLDPLSLPYRQNQLGLQGLKDFFA